MTGRLMWTVTLLCLATSPSSAWTEEKKPEVRLERDLVYCKIGETELKLDLAIPVEGTGPYPAIVCIHGGGWRYGSRQDMAKPLKDLGNQSFIELLASRGYVAATVSYRLSTAARFPAQIEDCKAAVRWLRANARTYKVDGDRIAAGGFSAGAHLACLLGATDKKDGFEGVGNLDQSSRVQAVISFFGPTDLAMKGWAQGLEEHLMVPLLGATFLDKPELYKHASPCTYVTKQAPPFLFFHGTEDKLVPLEQSRSLADKLQALGVVAKLVVLEGEGHGWGGEKLLNTMEQTVLFLNERVKK